MGIYSLCYVSRALLEPAEAKAAVASIVDVSRERNARLDVTGALLFTGAHFAQILEGPRGAIRELMASIERDARHRDVTIVREGPAERRAFGSWTLAYAGPSTFINASISKAFDAEPAGPSRLLKLFEEFAITG